MCGQNSLRKNNKTQNNSKCFSRNRIGPLLLRTRDIYSVYVNVSAKYL